MKQLLSHVGESCASDNKQYICKTCHLSLHTKCNQAPSIPKALQTKHKSSPAQRFLNAVENKPEFVCTCCHYWLFRKSVSVFDEKQYNFNNPIVANALSEKHRY